MSRVIRNLKGAKAVLLTRGWTRGWFAKDREGRHVSINSPEACSFCIVGALRKSAGGFDVEREIEVLEGTLPYTISVAVFNDAQESVAPVIQLIDDTIARLEA